MSLSSFLRILAGTIILTVASQGVTINVVATNASGRYLTSSGANLASGSIFNYGVLNVTGFNALTPTEQKDYAHLLSSVFTSYGTFAFNSTGELSVAGQPLSGGTAGDLLTALVYDSVNQSIGLFRSTNALWTYPTEPGFATLSSPLINTVYLGTIVPGSPQTYKLEAIPEPSLAALLAGLGALAFLAARRRFRLAPAA